MNKIDIYTDGSCNNQKQDLGGGIGIVMLYGKHIKEISEGPFEDANSARMEIMAVIRALEILSYGYEITIYSDNKYVVNTHEKGWLSNWIKTGMLNEKANPDLWKRFLKILHKHESGGSTIKLKWVRGHSGNKYNEIADKLANEGRLNS